MWDKSIFDNKDYVKYQYVTAIVRIQAATLEASMEVRLSATPKGNGYQATITMPDGVAISSAEAFPSEAEAILAAAEKLRQMPERLERLKDDEPDAAPR